MKLSLCLKSNIWCFPLFSTQTTGHFCITQPQSLCCGILSCQELLTADKLLCEGQCFPSQNSWPCNQEREDPRLKQGEDICSDSLPFSGSRNLVPGMVVGSIPKLGILWDSAPTHPSQPSPPLQIINCWHCPKSQQTVSQFCIPAVQPINNNWKCDIWLTHKTTTSVTAKAF